MEPRIFLTNVTTDNSFYVSICGEDFEFCKADCHSGLASRDVTINNKKKTQFGPFATY